MPIVFYDGNDEWTAETNFLNRTEMNGIFEKYIPKFKYELVSLRDYGFEDLAKFGDVLSLFMMVDKLRTAEAFHELGKLREEYGAQLNNLDVPPHLKELLVKVITLLLRKISVPQDEIEKLVEEIDERGISEMLAIENYNVQETRKQAKEEERRKRLEAERQAGALVQLLLKQGLSPVSIAESLATTEQKIIELISFSPQVQDLQ